MAIVSLAYSKLNAEKTHKRPKGQITIKYNMALTGVKKAEITSESAKKGVLFEFKFGVEYAPSVGSIEILGHVISVEDEAKAEEIIELWEKQNRIDKDIAASIWSVVYDKCILKAINLAQDMNLPAPVQLPKIKVEDKK